MVTCFLKYEIDPYKVEEFEAYAKMWIPLVNKFGGTHNGYFLPAEGANNIALALFTFPSLAAYEIYRRDSMQDPECIIAFEYAEQTKCIVSYERSFFRPIFNEGN
ncbi:NIPSNAP family protein [Alteromonadaceae bacterium M269]|nr:NIPSNAP family protein [Alteromonadaceae bacterium M269]